jgi:hypothetical protein
MLHLANIHSWLSNSTTESKDKLYRHRLLKENREQRDEVIGELKQYFHIAHEDARQRLEKLTSDSLDPLDDSASLKEYGYPEKLPLNNTLKGYFGEVMAALFIENFVPFEKNNWEIPAFLFRFDLQAFQYLEELQQGGNERQVVNRPGNDCLAFQRNDKNEVTHILCCEAKCTNSHSSTLIMEAHQQLSKKIVDILQIIEVLREKQYDSNSQQWISSLQKYRLLLPTENYERYDLVSYVCGRSSKRKSKNTWINANQPHKKYTGKRPLEAVEIHLHDVDELIKEVYGKPR